MPAAALRVGGAPPCLLAFHGFGGSPTELQPMLDRVHAAGFAVRAPLLPGHGTTPRDLQNRTFADWLAYAEGELADAQRDHGTVIVLGFSMGSLVAIELALAHPVVGLVVIGNALELTAPLRATFGALDRLGLRAPDLYVPKPRPADMEDRAAAKKLDNYDRHPFRAAGEVHRAGLRLRAEVHRLDVPTLILHGAKDRVCPVANATWLASQIAHATVRIYPRSAHVVVPDYDRDVLADDVIAFVRRLSVDR